MAALGALIAAAEEVEHLPPHARCHLEQMKAQLQDMDQLCGLLVDELPSMRRFGLDDVARHVVGAAEHVYDCQLELRAGRCEILADATGLGRAVWNLVDNGCRAAGPSGTVRVTVRSAGSLALLEVEDSGPGFGAGPTGRASLGLSIVEHVARAHHGRVGIGRSELGGASVALTLPLPPAGPSTIRMTGLLHPASPGRLSGPGPLTFVICDDHQMFAESLSCVLRARGHDVVACTSEPGVAIAEVAARRPDILVMDLAFPDADGVDALRASLGASPATRAVVLSGSGNPEWFAHARSAGAAACLVKQGDMDDILDAIAAVATGEQILDWPPEPAPADPQSRSGDDSLLRNLTERERQVLDRLVGGQRTSAIAAEMGMALSTTRTHIQSILYKLGAHSRLEAVSIVTAASRVARQPWEQSARNTPFDGGDTRGRREG